MDDSTIFPAIKLCPRCNIVKPAALFYKSKTSKDGMRSHCIACMTEARIGLAFREKIQASEKTCTKCKEIKPIVAFVKNKYTIDGFECWCKACVKAYHVATADRIKARMKATYVRNCFPETYVLPDEKSCSHCHQTKPVDQFSKRKEGFFRLHSQCKDCQSLSNRKSYEANADDRRRRTREYMKNHPEVSRHWNRVRRARKNNAPGDGITKKDTAHMRAIQGNRCAYCHVDMREVGETLDHIISLKYGGRHSPENACLCCGHCNSSKGERSLSEWLEWRVKVSR